LINFEDIKNPETAKLYTTKELYLTEAEVEKYFKKNSSEFDYLPGYMVNDATLGDLGTVKEVIESPGQILITFDYQGRERIIPIVDELVLEINMPLKVLKMDLPEGILEV
jgi:16S rRNA processing protein RimM